LSKSLISLIIIFCFFSSASHAKLLANKDKVDQANEYFMSQLFSGEVESAFSLMTAYIGDNNREQFVEYGKKAAPHMKKIALQEGNPLSFALLKKQSVGEHLYKVSYLLKYSEAAVIWELNYYQADLGWKLVDIQFNTDINALFDN